MRRWLHGEIGPLAVVGCAWQNRQLLARLTEREIEAAFRGSILGKLWSALVPLFMLALFTFVFGVVLNAKWPGSTSTLDTALFYFAGLLVYNYYFDCIGRAPGLMLENVSYIKRVVFPLDVLAWVVIGSSLFRLAISSIILLAFTLVLRGLPPITALASPLFLIPFTAFALSGVWFLAALGVYIRDFRQIIGVLSMAFMYMTPLFYPLSMVPEPVQWLFYLNPLTYTVEGLRGALFWNVWPDPSEFILYSVIAWLVAWGGHAWFLSVRHGFADVV